MKSVATYASSKKDESKQNAPLEQIKPQPLDQVAVDFICMIKCMEQEIENRFE